MDIILACTAWATFSTVTAVPAVGGMGLQQDIYNYDERRVTTNQRCEVFRTVEKAVLSHYDRGKVDDTLQLYTINVEKMTVAKIKTPKVTTTVEVEKVQ